MKLIKLMWFNFYAIIINVSLSKLHILVIVVFRCWSHVEVVKGKWLVVKYLLMSLKYPE
jgi:hypothetical protein